MNVKIRKFNLRSKDTKFTIKFIPFLIQVMLIGSLLQFPIFSDAILFPSTAAESDQLTFRSMKNNSSVKNYIPEITSYSITPRYGTINDQFVLIMTYRDHEDAPPAYVQVVIDEKIYDLLPVNPKDQNHSNGKDYFIRLKFSDGVHILYFQTSDGYYNITSSATTISITTTENENTFTHLDVVYGILLATAIFMIPFIYGIYQIRKLGKTFSNLEYLKRNDFKKRKKKDIK